MLEGLVGQFMQSGAGAQVLKELQGKGLSPQEASSAVSATADGAALQLGTSSGLGAIAGALGGAAGGGLGGLGGLLGGATTPAAPAPGAPGAGGPLAAMVGPVAQFVSQKTGLPLATAQTVVAVALPKLLELLKPKADAGGAAGGGGALGGLGGLLG